MLVNLLFECKVGPHLNFTGPHSVERAAHLHRCNSRVQHLKQTIGLQIEAVARLIYEDKDAVVATPLLNELTSELIAAGLGLCPERDERTGSAILGSGAARLQREHSSVYDPDQLSALGRIFDEAVAALPANMRTPANRTQIAKLIFGRAAITEVEPGSLIKLIIAICLSRLIKHCCVRVVGAKADFFQLFSGRLGLRETKPAQPRGIEVLPFIRFQLGLAGCRMDAFVQCRRSKNVGIHNSTFTISMGSPPKGFSTTGAPKLRTNSRVVATASGVAWQSRSRPIFTGGLWPAGNRGKGGHFDRNGAAEFTRGLVSALEKTTAFRALRSKDAH
ncbi:hypothetical protein ABIB82_006432 [Bradyrhizobium sp. i1.8.4]